jgi:protein-disulfide isomerase/uncharacterized membrane protein
MNLNDWRRPALNFAILVVCAVAGWLSEGLLEIHDAGVAGPNTVGSMILRLCGAGKERVQPDAADSGCAASARSTWSEVHFIPGRPDGIPVALLAIAYFTTLGIWYAFVGDTLPAWPPLRWLPIGLAVTGGYVSLYYLSVMGFGKSPWCIGCVAVHGLNFILLALILASRRSMVPPAPSRLSAGQTAAVLCFALFSSGSLYFMHDREARLQDRILDMQPASEMVAAVQRDPHALIAAFLAQPQSTIPLRPDEQSAGQSHCLVVYLDFQCPACAAMESSLTEDVAPRFNGRLNVVLRHYPLCKACNAETQKDIHPAACSAARAAEAARLLAGTAGFLQMSRLLFAHQDELPDVIAASLAADAGLDRRRFADLLDSPITQQRISEDVASAQKLAVTTTPTLFLDGRCVPRICWTPLFWQTVATQSTTRPAGLE